MNIADIVPNLYPKNLLQDCDSGLCLFGAGFYGRNDAIHMYDAGLTDVTVVDNDLEKLQIMQDLYPKSWAFQRDDIDDWLPTVDRTWDIVSVDSPIGLFSWVLVHFNDIALLANKYIVITMSRQLQGHTHYYINNLDWELSNTITRSASGEVILLIFKRVAALSEAGEG